MPDITKLSDEELNRMLAESEGAKAPSNSASDITKLSDEELTRMLGETDKKTDTSLTGALAYGGERAASALGSLVSETGKRIGGGKQFPKIMAKVAQYLHNPNYRPGAEDIMAPDATLGERAAGLGRTLLEGAPTLAAGAVGGLPGLAAAGMTLGAGSGIERVRQADQVPENVPLDAGQLSRVGQATAIETAANLIPGAKALAPLKGATGSLPAQLLRTTGREIANTAKVAGLGAVTNVAATAAETPILENRAATLDELAAAGIAGGAIPGALRAAKLPTAIGQDIRFSRFGNSDPQVLAAAAKRLQDATGGYGKIKEGNAEDIRKNALAASKADLDFEARGQQTKGSNLIEDQVNQLSAAGDPSAAKAYTEVMSAINRGEPVNRNNINTLKNVLQGNPVGDAWLSRLEEASTLGELGNMGLKKGSDARLGGLHATRLGQANEWLAEKFGMGSLGIGLAGHALGMGSVGQVGAALGAGTTGIAGLLRGIDRMTGYSDPVGSFARRYQDPTTYSGPARAIQNTVSGGSSSPSPSGPPAPPLGPSGAPPVVNPLAARIAAVTNRGPISSGPQMQGPPARMPQDNGFPGVGASMPQGMPDPIALVRARQALGQDNGPITQDNAPQFPPSSMGQDNAPMMMMQDNNGPTMVPPPGGSMPNGYGVQGPQAVNDIPSPAALARMAKLNQMLGAPAPGEDLTGPALLARGRDNEVPLDYQGQSPVTSKLDALLGKETPAPKPNKTKATPKETKVEATVSYMEEALNEPSSPKKYVELPILNGKYKLKFNEANVSDPAQKARVIAGAEERIRRRQKYIDHIKEMIPEHSKALQKFMDEKFVDKGDERAALGQLRAEAAMRDFLKELKVPEKTAKLIIEKMDASKHKGIGIPVKNWNPKE